MRTLGLIIFSIILVVVNYIVWSDMADAAEMALQETDSGTKYIAVWGDIEETDPEQLDDLLTETGAKYVVFNSPGGNANAGLELAYVISDHGVTTVVPEGAGCLSACAIAFLGGETKILDGVLGFHVAWTMADMPVNEAMRGGQYFGISTAAVFMDHGYSIVLPYIVTLVTSSDTFLIFTSTEDLNTFFIGKDKPASRYTKEVDFLDDAWLEDHLYGPDRLNTLFGG